jgi:hypothetical protein
MEMKTGFETFLTEIRPTSNQISDMKSGHETLRTRLNGYSDIQKWIIGTFIQGSYRRSTAIRPKNDERSDVDVVVVTSIPQTYTPSNALKLFEPFMEKYYHGKWRRQGRSIGISLSYVDLDLVITSAPSEAFKQQLAVITSLNSDDDPIMKSNVTRESEGLDFYSKLINKAEHPKWKQEPLYIPDRNSGRWEQTNPLAQIEWTREKNNRCSGYYVNVVKIIKWWRRINLKLTGSPKGYPLEHLIGNCCPDDLTTIADGVTRTLERIVAFYGSSGRVPMLYDHGVAGQNVMSRVSYGDWQTFIAEVKDAAILARAALNASTNKESADAWRKLLGNKFPDSSSSNSGLLNQESVNSISFQSKPGGPKKPGGFA